MISPLGAIRHMCNNPCTFCMCAECYATPDECPKKAMCNNCNGQYKVIRGKCNYEKHKPFTTIEKNLRIGLLFLEAIKKNKIRM